MHKQYLEQVQSFDAKIVSKWWQKSPSTSKQQLGWSLLETRIYSKLCVYCNRILKEESLIKSSVL